MNGKHFLLCFLLVLFLFFKKTFKNRATLFHRECFNYLLGSEAVPQGCYCKDVLKICSKYTREHSRGSKISVKLFCKFIEMKLLHKRSPVHLLYIFIRPNTSEENASASSFTLPSFFPSKPTNAKILKITTSIFKLVVLMNLTLT